MNDDDKIHDGAAVLRAEFDQSFAEQPRELAEAPVDVIAVRAADRPYAVRAKQILEVLKTPKITAVPSPTPDLLGIIGVRGALVPVYDIAALLGHAKNNMEAPWIVIHGETEPIALCFQAIDGYFKIRNSQFHFAEQTQSGKSAAEVVHLDSGVVAVIDIAALAGRIRKDSEALTASKER